MMQQNRAKVDRGFALVAALFLIIVLAALGVFAVKIANTQQQSIDLELLGIRAQSAADSGIEYAASQLLKNGKNCTNIAGAFNFTQGALQGFTTQITCTYSNHVDGTATYNVYELTSTATYGTYGTTNYVSRKQQRTVMN